jgi:hypothetical protein
MLVMSSVGIFVGYLVTDFMKQKGVTVGKAKERKPIAKCAFSFLGFRTKHTRRGRRFLVT